MKALFSWPYHWLINLLVYFQIYDEEAGPLVAEWEDLYDEETPIQFLYGTKHWWDQWTRMQIAHQELAGNSKERMGLIFEELWFTTGLK